jgi:hypothetical protein
MCHSPSSHPGSNFPECPLQVRVIYSRFSLDHLDSTLRCSHRSLSLFGSLQTFAHLGKRSLASCFLAVVVPCPKLAGQPASGAWSPGVRARTSRGHLVHHDRWVPYPGESSPIDRPELPPFPPPISLPEHLSSPQSIEPDSLRAFLCTSPSAVFNESDVIGVLTILSLRLVSASNLHL